VAGFYRRPNQDDGISQGDIFTNVPIPGTGLLSPTQLIVSDGKLRTQRIEPGRIASGIQLVENVSLTDAMVISQSCDAERAVNLMLAPISELSLDAKSNEKKWKSISHAATSLAEPRHLYLPGNSHLKFSRGVADFGEAFTLPRQFLEVLAQQGRRVARLGDAALRFLQFRMGVMLTRLAQDDFSWPSKDDLDIRIAFLDEEIVKAKRKREKDAASATEPDDSFLAILREQDERIRWLEQTRSQCEQARNTADDLAE